jgi:hypothetical protein
MLDEDYHRRRQTRVNGQPTAGASSSTLVRQSGGRLAAAATEAVGAVPGHYLDGTPGYRPNLVVDLPPQLAQAHEGLVARSALIIDSYTGQTVERAEEMTVLRQLAFTYGHRVAPDAHHQARCPWLGIGTKTGLEHQRLEASQPGSSLSPSQQHGRSMGTTIDVPMRP